VIYSCEADAEGRFLLSIALGEKDSDSRLRQVLRVAKGHVAGMLLQGSQVSNEGLSLLHHEKQLKWLNLNNTDITDRGLMQLGGLPALETLALENTAIRGPGLAILQDCRELRQLSLEGTLINDDALRLIGSLPGLENLDLSHTNVSVRGLRHLSRLPSLRHLGLCHTSITPDDIETLRGILPRTCRVWLQVDRSYSMQPKSEDPLLDGAAQESDSGEKSSSTTPQTLKLERESGKYAPPQALPENIRHAWRNAGARLRWMRMTEDGDIRFLNEQDAQSGDLPVFELHTYQQHLLADMPAPESPFGLDLALTETDDAALKLLSPFKGLQWLNLSGTCVTDAGLKPLVELKQLRGLALMDTKLTDAGLEQLARLTDLQWLDLSGTRVTDLGLAKLVHLEKLRWLGLDNTGVTDKGLAKLLTLRRLRMLSIQGTHVSDKAVRQLRKALPQCYVFR